MLLKTLGLGVMQSILLVTATQIKYNYTHTGKYKSKYIYSCYAGCVINICWMVRRTSLQTVGLNKGVSHRMAQQLNEWTKEFLAELKQISKIDEWQHKTGTWNPERDLWWLQNKQGNDKECNEKIPEQEQNIASSTFSRHFFQAHKDT